jgi:hypothetical protein
MSENWFAGDVDSSTTNFQNAESSSTWFAAKQTRQRTDSLEHKLVSKSVCCNINSSTNSFTADNEIQQRIMICCTQHNSSANTDSLPTIQFGNKCWFTTHNTIWLRTLLRCREHNSAANTDSLHTTQFDSKHWFAANNGIQQWTLVHYR